MAGEPRVRGGTLSRTDGLFRLCAETPPLSEQLSFLLGEEPPDILRSLTDEQRRAVEHGEGPLLIVAGAGTGKTHVLTARIVHLITARRPKPRGLRAGTFTARAAAPMRARGDLHAP